MKIFVGISQQSFTGICLKLFSMVQCVKKKNILLQPGRSHTYDEPKFSTIFNTSQAHLL